jgi:hypothetical protein
MRWWAGVEYMYKDFLTEEGRRITGHRRRIEREVKEFRKTDQFLPRKSGGEYNSPPSPDAHARDR